MSAHPLSVAVLVGTAFAAAAACTEPTHQPPPLGGCTPTYDAACVEYAGGGGGGGGGPVDAGAPPDSPFEVEPTDATTTCGQADTMIAVVSPSCAACVAAGQDAGSLSCCSDDTACSGDSVCLQILACAITCPAGVACCSGFTQAASVVTFNTFANCMQLACPAVCPALSTVSLGD